jgi:D-beta-D-heptose 7-phosphate kinase/D-beta-D-heptose 1-phosphate adenosyltransferase
LNKIIKEKKSNIKIFVDPNPKLSDYSIYKNSFFISPNKTEFEKAFGKFKNIKDLERKIRKAKKALNIKNFVVTLGAKGMILVDHLNNTHFFKALAKEVFDVSGAGDTVISSAAYFFSKDQCIKEAINKSNIAAAIVVSKFGTSIVSNNEIENFQSKHLSTKIVSQKELFLELKKINNKNIVVTNGCFDILHPGHLTYLKKAKDLGDIFIIAVNDNNSVSKLKGKNRPINNLNHRQKMLKLLDVADYVTSFSENNPHKLYSLIKPNIIVKGGDYKKEDVVGHDIVSKYSGKIEILPFEKGFSTSKIIKKISKN